MPLTLKAELKGLLTMNVHRFATLWRIERTDGIVLKFTDHDIPIVYRFDAIDEEYTPAGGWDATSREKQAGVRDSNLETRGVLTHDAITADDLRAGLYREARVVELVVDWRFPYAGPFQSNIYFIAGVTYSDEVWQANLSGQPVWLRKEVGTVLNRLCPHDVGYGICGQGVNLDDHKFSAAVTDIIERRRVFVASALAPRPPADFDYGEMLWTTGRNEGLKFEVLEHTAGGRLVFSLQMPYDFILGDTFDIWQGCDGLFDTCKTKFNNVVNFGGFPALIGTDRMVGPAKDKAKTF